MQQIGCHFFDAERATRSSQIDGVHLDSEQHLKLGHAPAEGVPSILAPAG